MIPENKDFSEFFKSISLKDPGNNEYEKVSITLSPSAGKIDEYDEGVVEGVVAHDKIQFWSKPGDKISLKSVVRKLTEELENKGHVASAKICASILSIYALHPDKEKKPIELINGLIEEIGPCNLTQYCVTSLPYNREWNYEMPPFHIGTLDLEKLKFACSKIPSDFYERYKDDLPSTTFTIQRNISRVNLIPLSKFLYEISSSQLDPQKFFLNTLTGFRWAYFEAVSEVLAIEFWQDWDQRQQLSTALVGGQYISIAKISRDIKGFFSVYRNLGVKREGFMFPIDASKYYVNLQSLHKTIPESLKILKDDYGISEFQDTEIHQILKSYCRFFCLGKNEWDNDKINEAFLNFMIGVEIALSEENGITKSLSQRAAVMLSHRKPEQFNFFEKSVEDLYKSRSRFVHNGKDISLENLELLSTICFAIFLVLLRLQKNNTNHDSGAIKKWHQRLDYLAGALRANKVMSEDEFRQCGIVTPVK